MKSPAHPRGIYRFGQFEFDAARSELRKNGLKIRLGQQSCKVLHLLLQCDGNLCTREELRQELWPTDTFVEFEHSLNKAIWALRQALGDVASSPRFVETVAGQGYRFLVLREREAQAAAETGKSRKLESIAVIPPANLTSGDESAYFAVQLTCGLINKLCQLQTMRVLSYSAVKKYSLATMDAVAAGKELGVDAVLAGELLQRNGTMAIILELIDAVDGGQIWGTQRKEAWPQAAESADQIVDAVVQQLQPILIAAAQKGITSAKRPKAKSSGTRNQILKPTLLSLPARPKRAFVFP